MKKVKGYNEYITERFNTDATANVLDLIHILEQKDPNSFIVQINLKNLNDKKPHLFILDKFVQVGSEKSKMNSLQYYTEYKGSKYKFFTYEIETDESKLFNTKFSEEERGEVKLKDYKTIGDHITELKKIEDPENTLFFIRSRPIGYNTEGQTFENVFETLMGLGNYNIETYPLAKGEEIMSGDIKEAFTFMGKGTDGRFQLEDI